MSASTATTPSVAARSDVASIALAVVSAAVPASLLCLLVALVARAAGASPDFRALTAATFVPFVVIGVAAGAIGWTLIRRRAADPATLLGRLVPAVVVLGLVPDVLVGVSGSLPGTSWVAVTALMLMHLVVAACAIPAYRHFLPLH